MPRRLLAELSAEEVETLLAHEFAHLCRRDHWLRWLELVVTAAYWWHPVVWWAKAAIGRAEEEACDAWVVTGFPDASARYASALFKAFSLRPPIARPRRSWRVPSAGGDLKERIEHIMNATWKPRLFLPVRLLVLAAAMLILPLSLRAVGEEDTTTQSVRRKLRSLKKVRRQRRTLRRLPRMPLTPPQQQRRALTPRLRLKRRRMRSTRYLQVRRCRRGTADNPFAAQPAGGSQPGMQPRRVIRACGSVSHRGGRRVVCVR